jgi:6-phosphogluconate dehydrogenase
MKVGIIGLGKMGNGVAARLRDAGHEVIGFDYSQAACQAARDMGVTIMPDLDTFARETAVAWLFVPAGDPVDAVLKSLMAMSAHAIIIDGGNSKFTDSMRRAAECQQKNIYFLDCGTSGGVFGRENGYSLMVGGDEHAYKKVLPLLQAVATPGGVGHVGPSGAGHYVKMVHNGIEYGLMQAYAEGFDLIKNGSFKEQNLDLEKITGIWLHGSVIRSWLLELAHTIFKKDQRLDSIGGDIQESGTGSWTVDDAHKNKIPVPVIDQALKVRAWSRTTGGNYATKIVALLRNAFGGHSVTHTK